MTTGVHEHGGRGRWLVNGSAEGLVELGIDPPSRVSPSIDTMFGLGPSRVNQLTLSLDDPDGFIAAVEGDARGSRPSPNASRKPRTSTGPLLPSSGD